MIERTALALLFIASLVMGYNIAATAERFGDAAESFDLVDSELSSFEYRGLDQGVALMLEVTNPSSQPVEVVEIDYSYRANGTSVGGGNLRPEVEVDARGARSFDLEGTIVQKGPLEGLEPGSEITWTGNVRVLVSVDEDVDPEWIDFVFRWVTN